MNITSMNITSMKRARFAFSSALAATFACVAPLPLPAQPLDTTRVTFSEDIAPILYEHCVTCHRPGEIGPFPLISYEDAMERGDRIAEVTAARYMPPWHAEPGYGAFVGERWLSDEQVELLGAWAEQGMARGDAARMPELPSFPDGWELGEPDLVLEMPVAFELPPGGHDVYRNFVLPTGLGEDRWVAQWSCVPTPAPLPTMRCSPSYRAARLPSATAPTGGPASAAAWP